MTPLQYRQWCQQQAGKDKTATARRHAELVSQIRPLAGKYSSREIGARIGISAGFVRTLASNHGISLAQPRRNAITADDYVLIQQLEATGMPDTVICEKFECTELELELAHLHYGADHEL